MGKYGCIAVKIAGGASNFKNTRYRIAIYNIVGFAHLDGAKYDHDHKTVKKTDTPRKHFRTPNACG